MTLSPLPSNLDSHFRALQAELEGELSQAANILQEHSEDASIYQQIPLAVAYPKNKQDLEKILRFAREHHLPLHAWGAGTSRGGQPIGRGIVLNFRKHWNQILAYDEATGNLRIAPGVYYGEVQKFLKTKGRSFPPDPSYHQCTVGGMVANNAAGIHSVKYGGTIEHIAALEFFTADGELHHTDKPDALSQKIASFLKKNERIIAEDFPKVEKNSAGYSLNRAWENQQLDLTKLLTGSEGTLGIITELTLKSVPLPQATALGILYFSTLEAALIAAMDLRTYDIAACELVDKVLLDLHAAHTEHTPPPQGPKHAKKLQNPFLDLFYEKKAQAILIVEIEGKSQAEADNLIMQALPSMKNYSHWHHAKNKEEEKEIWDLRRHTSPILNKLEDGKITIKPLWAVEDVSLPKEQFLAYVREQEKIFAKYGLTCSFFGHAASCNLHIDPIAMDPRIARKDLELAKTFDLVAEESYDLVIRMGGSISGEHGDGITRTRFLPQQYPRSYPLFIELKYLFDPEGLLNPGKIVLEGDIHA